MPTQVIVSASAEEPGRGFDASHPLAEVVARLHREHGGKPFSGIGRVGCGPCWERAIRDDERFAIEFGLPRELNVDLSYVDEIAVSKACSGHKTMLTATEKAAAMARLLDAGLTRSHVARRLGLNLREVPRGWTKRKASGRSLSLLTCEMVGVARERPAGFRQGS